MGLTSASPPLGASGTALTTGVAGSVLRTPVFAFGVPGGRVVSGGGFGTGSALAGTPVFFSWALLRVLLGSEALRGLAWGLALVGKGLALVGRGLALAGRGPDGWPSPCGPFCFGGAVPAARCEAPAGGCCCEAGSGGGVGSPRLPSSSRLVWQFRQSHSVFCQETGGEGRGVVGITKTGKNTSVTISVTVRRSLPKRTS